MFILKSVCNVDDAITVQLSHKFTISSIFILRLATGGRFEYETNLVVQLSFKKTKRFRYYCVHLKRLTCQTLSYLAICRTREV